MMVFELAYRVNFSAGRGLIIAVLFGRSISRCTRQDDEMFRQIRLT